MEFVGSRPQFGQGNHPPTTFWLPNWQMLMWVLGGQRLGQEPQRANPNDHSQYRIPNVCVWWGSERSKWLHWTYFTHFPIGHCVVAAAECSCTVAMEPAVYRVGPNGCAAIGGWGAAQFSLWSDTAQWQWPVAPMGIGVGATLSAAMGLGWLGEFLSLIHI